MGDRDDTRHDRRLAQSGGRQRVKAGEEIVDIETDKIVNSFEARTAGTLVRVLGEVGDELPVGQLIGVIAAGAVADATRSRRLLRRTD